MKGKISTILLILLFAFTFVACGNMDAQQQEDDSKDEQQEEVIGNEQEIQEELQEELSGKLQVQAAWKAVGAYGNTQFTTFEVRYFPGQPVEAIAEDADTWFLKAQCIADGEIKTCEAKVTGTTEDPQVISFEVY